MLTNLRIERFKQFESIDIELGSPVIFIGPNNSGKTTALQALALWDIGLKRWLEKRSGRETPKERPGVTINRRDLIAVPIPDANLLWRDLEVRHVQRIGGKPQTQNVRIEITVDGVSDGKAWTCGLEFDYANPESLYCRPLRVLGASGHSRMPIPPEAASVRLAFLPPMSGLAANETHLDPGAINVRLGEGRTAEVLRNLCYQILIGSDGEVRWRAVRDKIDALFGVVLEPPVYIAERGEIAMTYQTPSGCILDLSSSGRGLQQTLLLLAHLTVNAGSVLLLDEPDAHLEILRQRQIYQLLAESARESGSQIIAASHSEVILDEAADRDVVIAFLGKPHRIDDRGSQLLKSLKAIGFDQYYQAEQTGWVLYLEGSTDLAILRAFAGMLNHRARHRLERPFVHYVYNQPQKARDHFEGLREAKPDLVGVALFDRQERELQDRPELREYMWRRREIESYLCTRETLLAWARDLGGQGGDQNLFSTSWVAAMEETIAAIAAAMETLEKGPPWSADTKASDDFLDPMFKAFFKKLGLPNLMRKTDYHQLARYVPTGQLDPEISRVLDIIDGVASKAHPRTD